MNTFMRLMLMGICLFLAGRTIAQPPITTDSFTGVWELKERKLPNQQAFTAVPPGQYKMFTADNKLQLFQVTQKGTFITSYGKFRVLTDSTLEEAFEKSIYFPDPKPGITIFKFIDSETLSSKFGGPGSYVEETWKKIPYAGDIQK